MPRTRKKQAADFPEDVLDHFAGPAGVMSQADVEAACRRFKKAMVERMRDGELTHHLGYPPGGEKPPGETNQRNGTSKTVLTDDGLIPLDIPRDRDGTFEPQLIPKHVRRFDSVDDTILALYGRGLTVRETRAFLAERYVVDVSADFISTVTDAVHEEGTAWQSRPLEPMYPVVFFDALRVTIRDEATVRSKAVANGLDYANGKERKPLAAALQPIYTAPSADAAAAELDAFEQGPWGRRFPTVGASWRRAWPHGIPFFAFSPAIRRVLYTTNALERGHTRLPTIIKTRGHFPNDAAATKLLWLALRNITVNWWTAANSWHLARHQFAIASEDRFTRPPA